MINEQEQKEKEIKMYQHGLLYFKLFFIFLIILLLIIIIPYTFAINNINPKVSTSDINYDFNENILYNTTNFEYDNSWNIRNQTEITENYSATYTWNYSQIGLTNLEIDLIDDIVAGGLSKIIESYQNHNIVLYYNCNGAYKWQYHSFNEKINGTIEFWINLKETNIRHSFWLAYGLSFAFMESGSIATSDGANLINISTYTSNQWYHVRIDFECSSGGYMDLTEDHYFIYINGKKFGEYAFSSAQTSMNQFVFGCGASDGNIYLDAIGFNWNSYNIHENIIPIIETTNTLEVDKWTFKYDTFQHRIDDGADIFNGWNENDDVDDVINIFHGNGYNYVRFDYSSIHFLDYSLNKTFDINCNIINITFDTYITEMLIGGATEFGIKVYSLESNLILDLYHESNRLKSGSDTLAYALNDETWYTIQLYINYNDNITVVNFYESDIYIDTYYFPLLDDGYGLGYIEILLDGSVGTYDCYINDIGIYVNGISTTSEHAYINKKHIYSTPIYYYEQWYFSTHNLFTHNVIGNYCFWISPSNYLPVVTNINNITKLCYYETSENRISNLYDFLFGTSEYPYLTDGMLWIEFYNTNVSFTINNIKISGVRLNEYIPEYTYQNIDINTNYFYIINDKLCFNFEGKNDNLEYMRIIFDINNILTENYSLQFKSDLVGNLFVDFRIDYLDSTLDLYPLPYYKTITSIIMNQEKIIDKIGLLITDNDLLNTSIYGYISNIKLVYIPDIIISLITLNILAILIPFIIIFVPTFSFYKILGKNSLIPLLLFMSVICFIAELISSWLFFIFLYSFTIMLYITRKYELE